MELVLYGGTESVIHGLDVFLKELEKLAQIAQGTVVHYRVLRLLALGYQLQNCVLRDRRHYPQASIAYQKAFNIAQELEDNELAPPHSLGKESLSSSSQRRSKPFSILITRSTSLKREAFPSYRATSYKHFQKPMRRTSRHTRVGPSLNERKRSRYNQAKNLALSGLIPPLLSLKKALIPSF